mgnify:CR=1 FL=1
MLDSYCDYDHPSYYPDDHEDQYCDDDQYPNNHDCQTRYEGVMAWYRWSRLAGGIGIAMARLV